MKKLVSIILFILLILSFVACGNTTDNSEHETVETVEEYNDNDSDDYVDDVDEDVDSDDSSDGDEEEIEEEKDIVPFDWTKAVYKVEDNDGYKYEITVKLSPWILTTNSDTIESAWNEVGDDNELPISFDDWNLEKNGNSYWRDSVKSATVYYSSFPFASPMNNMYLCMGSVTIKNLTDGWDITESESRSINFPLYYNSSETVDDKSNTMGRIYYSSGTKDFVTGVRFNSKMTENEWGPCTFVIMAPENITPKNSKGEYYKYFKDKESLFRFGGYGATVSEKSHKINGKKTKDKLRIGVIGKNGKYVKP